MHILNAYLYYTTDVCADHTKQTPNGRHGSVFQLSRGDVVELLDETSQASLKADWMYGRLSRTGACGSSPYDCVYIIPTCERPPEDFMVGIIYNYLILCIYE